MPFLFLFLAVFSKKKHPFIPIITFISIAGVMAGVMALIVVLSVMTGFEEELKSKILGTNSHIVVLNHNGAIEDYRHLLEVSERFPGVEAASPFIFNQVMLTSDYNVTGVAIRGVDPATVGKVTMLGKYLVEGNISELNRPQEEKGGNPSYPGIIIGREASRSLWAFYGDQLNVVSPLGTMTPFGMQPRLKRFQVVGIFDSGMYEYDSSLAYISLVEAQRFFNMGDTVTGIELNTTDINKADKIAAQIQQELDYPYYARDWKEMNRNIFSALKLEKRTMFVILLIITMVASLTIVSTLIMMVMEKNREIAILKSMGATARSIMKIFITDGFVIGITGTILGLIDGYLWCFLLDRYQFIHLPGDVYYLTTLPVEMKPLYFLLVSLAAIGISFLATLYPSWQASQLTPVEAIRYE
ncbi:MAG: lipoprotein-releasing ABC transporter permease subunit [Deltaproteobacteria bacterium]|nr:MAG: lipoprotein-releasing ABC transporter permease subunit [Deltaproteobacteria bacterium]